MPRKAQVQRSAEEKFAIVIEGGWPTFTFFVKVGTARSALTAFP